MTEARTRRDSSHKLLELGHDPIAAKKAALDHLRKQQQEANRGDVPTFRECAESVIKLRQPEWKSDKHASQFAASLDNYTYPVIGDLPVNEVTDDHIMEILRPIWLSKNETAGRVRSRIATILGWAKVKKLREGDNPAAWKDNLEFLLQKPSIVKKVTRQPSLHYRHVPAFLCKLLTLPTSTASALATIIITGLRSSEVRLAKLREVNEETNVWSIPEERVKSPIIDGGVRFPHLVPIGPVELAILRKFAVMPNEFLYPGAVVDKAISEASVRKLIHVHGKEFGYFTMHGFRSSFKDWATEKSSLDDRHMVSEAQIGHRLGSAVEVAYLRTTLLERRRLLMRESLQYCLSQTPQKVLVGLGLSLADIEDWDFLMALLLYQLVKPSINITLYPAYAALSDLNSLWGGSGFLHSPPRSVRHAR